MRVLALGRSSPDSIMVVHTRTSTSPLEKSTMTCSRSDSCILPCPMAMRAWGTSRLRFSAARRMVCTRL